ncbi:double-strand break repair protein MRE11-like isoform X1 [Gossypium australe]|uniref:Double-strand break repair protein MRE11-like isoform X1 n=1 Tax=Gossypium australe TaxID=47621 RepID=A0A5B6UGQ9_9ROSI|nr:double-strand break repair protein MRE11-like isoform X1 [Gossypium australe]
MEMVGYTSIHLLILQERVKERSSHPTDTPQFTSSMQSVENIRSKNVTGIGSAASFSDDDDTAQILSSANRGRKGSSAASRSSRDAPELGKSPTRGRGRGRGRGASGLKQTTLDATLGFRRSQRSTSVKVQSIADDEENVDSASSEEHEINEVESSSDVSVRYWYGFNTENENDEITKGRGRKRAAPRGRGRGTTSKRGKKSDNSSVHSVFMNKLDDDDDDDAEEIARRFNKPQPRVRDLLFVTKSYGALRRGLIVLVTAIAIASAALTYCTGASGLTKL